MLRIAVCLLVACGLALPAFAVAPPGDAETDHIRTVVKEVLREYAATLGDHQADPVAKDMLHKAIQDNSAFMHAHKPDYFKPFVDAQHPRATVVTCSDARVHTHAFDDSPDNDIFMVRDLGNQISTAEGSVDYGVRNLHTPLLLIIGHSDCAAVRMAAGDYSKDPRVIRNELDTLQIPKGDGGMESVKLNVNNQVRYAMNKYEDAVLTGKLVVVGAVYDFRNDLQQGYGKLNIINIDGETDPRRIAAMDLMQGIDAKPAKKRRKGRSR